MSTEVAYEPWRPPALRKPLEVLEGLQEDALIMVTDAEKGLAAAERTLEESKAHLAEVKAHYDILTEAVRLHQEVGQ